MSPHKRNTNCITIASKRTYTLSLMIVFLSITINMSAQLPDSMAQKIDALFAKWNHDNTPGCAVGIVSNDSLIFAKGYGMASLEYNIPITPETPFNLASLSKQFTAYCIVLLAKQGKLHYDDDIRKYLPWFPDYGKKITIANLLNHTSGIRDAAVLSDIAGVNGEGVATNEDAFRMIKKQSKLNFSPGTDFIYSNSNYVLLAEIIKQVSGKSLPVFADSAIFQPLHMNNTLSEQDYHTVIKNKASSYVPVDSLHYGVYNSPAHVYGSTSIFSSVADMAKWIENFYAPKAGDTNDTHQLTEQPTVNNKVSLYAKGIEVDTYKGWRQFSHDGAVGGYRTTMAVFPDLRMGFVVLGNSGDEETYNTIDQLKDLFVADTSIHAVEMPVYDSTIKDLPSIEKLAGNYVSTDNILDSLFIKNDKLYINHDGDIALLVADAHNDYHPSILPFVTIHFSPDPIAHDTMLTVTAPSFHYRSFKYTPQPVTMPELQHFTGVYYCPDLEIAYNISLKDSSLFIAGIKCKDEPLKCLNKTRFTSKSDGLNLLQFTRDRNNNITGFEANSGRVLHLRFDKMK